MTANRKDILSSRIVEIIQMVDTFFNYLKFDIHQQQYNSAIANPSLLDTDSEMSVFTPNGEIVKQKNEILRLMDSSDIDYDRVKNAIIELAQLKYNCCSYDDAPQKTELLKQQLSDKKQLDSLDIELLKMCAKHITVSHNATIGLELINGVKLNNITER